MARRASEFRITVNGTITADMVAVKARMDAISGRSRVGVENWLRSMKNCTIYQHHARFLSGNEIQVGSETLTAERIFINVGGRAAVPDMPGLNQVSFLINSTMLNLDLLPRHLVIIGGSYVGLEFAQMYRRFGCEVTVVEMGRRLVQREDPDVADAIKEILESEGIHLRLSAECIAFAPQGSDILVRVSCAEGEAKISGSHVLLAVGRRPNTDDLGLGRAGVAVDGRGYVIVDDQLRTNVPGIWAVGDCNGRGAFTHTSYNDFEIVAANLLDNDPRGVSDRIPAHALYIDPSASPDRDDRDRGSSNWQARSDWSPFNDRDWKGNRKRGNEGIHESAGGFRKQEDPRSIHPRSGWGRGHSLHPGHHVRRGALHDLAARRPHSPDSLRTNTNYSRRPEAPYLESFERFHKG